MLLLYRWPPFSYYFYNRFKWFDIICYNNTLHVLIGSKADVHYKETYFWTEILSTWLAPNFVNIDDVCAVWTLSFSTSKRRKTRQKRIYIENVMCQSSSQEYIPTFKLLTVASFFADFFWVSNYIVNCSLRLQPK